MTVEQAALLLGISRTSAYELVHTGQIHALRLGRRLVVPVAWLAEQLGLEPADVFTSLEREPQRSKERVAQAASTAQEDHLGHRPSRGGGERNHQQLTFAPVDGA